MLRRINHQVSPAMNEPLPAHPHFSEYPVASGTLGIPSLGQPSSDICNEASPSRGGLPYCSGSRESAPGENGMLTSPETFFLLILIANVPINARISRWRAIFSTSPYGLRALPS